MGKTLGSPVLTTFQYPPFVKPGFAYPTVLNSSQRLWAKVSCVLESWYLRLTKIQLWDTCVKHNTHWFILTSYKHWVFGAFSPGKIIYTLSLEPIYMVFPGWCRAFVSDRIRYRESNPGVLQYIIYWMASAAACDDGYRIPKVGCTKQSNPRRVSTHARICDVFGQSCSAALALAMLWLTIHRSYRRYLNPSMRSELRSNSLKFTIVILYRYP
jgi:hypothetical protein